MVGRPDEPREAMARVLLAAMMPALARASCITEPSDPACKSYRYPNATADLDRACAGTTAPTSMSGCSIQRQCLTGGALASGAACDPFPLLTAAVKGVNEIPGVRSYMEEHYPGK